MFWFGWTVLSFLKAFFVIFYYIVKYINIINWQRSLNRRYMYSVRMPHCGDCETNFSNNSSLKAHIKRKHPGNLCFFYFLLGICLVFSITKVPNFFLSGKEDILCPKVGKSNSCSRVHVCKECSKTFVSFSNLRFHVKKKHSGRYINIFKVGRYMEQSST